MCSTRPKLLMPVLSSLKTHFARPSSDPTLLSNFFASFEIYPFPGQAMVHNSWHPPSNFMLYILPSTEDGTIKPDERDATFLLTH